jgi:L-aspartate oxidase
METDVLIIGCGIAGVTAALELSQERGRRVTVITRADDPEDCNTSHAQGGIAARGADDDADLLEQDILRAGAGLSFPASARLLAERGPGLLRRILVERAGVRFDGDPSEGPHFGLEAAHSRRRILHVADRTGQAIARALLAELRARPNVELLTDHTAVDLLTYPHHAPDPLAVYQEPRCHGVYALDRHEGKVDTIVAAYTVLATGGLGQIYLNTTNPPGSRGDGVAMAYRAGVRLANMEFVQFHPTALYMPGTAKFLISEAVRGEGAVLLDPDGRPFMERHEPEWKDLAPRDVVARAIYREMLANECPYVLLDLASHMPAAEIRRRFPGIHERCLEHDLDISERPIPVVPAAHYCCGGVLVDLWGKSSLDGLYAVGEVACTGLHGANRLAGTSLLEGLVWGARAAEDILRRPPGAHVSADEVPAWSDAGLIYDADPALVQGDLQTVRNLMWHYVGVLRSGYRLDRAIRELRHLWQNIEGFYRKARLGDGLIGLRNAVQTALIVAYAARQNRSSRGCHHREDAQAVGAAVPAGVALDPQETR